MKIWIQRQIFIAWKIMLTIRKRDISASESESI